MASHEHESGTTKQPIGLNRRTLIRTGAHVAWAVPAVAMVTPARAAAASNGLLVTATNGGWTGNTAFTARFAVTFNVTNTSAVPADQLRVSFTLPDGVTIQTLNVPSGWYQVNASGTNIVTLGLTPSSSLAAGASAGGTVTFDVDDPFAFILIPVNITATADAPIIPGNTSTTVAAAPVVLAIDPVEGTWTRQQGTRMRFSSRNIKNIGTQTTTGLKVLTTPPASFGEITAAVASGWTQAIAPNRLSVTWTPRDEIEIAGQGSQAFMPTLTFKSALPNSGSGTVQISVTADNPGTINGSGTAVRAP